jgi:hypothetical protein
MADDDVVIWSEENDGLVFELVISAEMLEAVKEGTTELVMVTPVVRIRKS